MYCIIEKYWKVFLTIFFTLFEDCLYFIEAILLLDFISDLLLKNLYFFIYFLYWDYFETGTILKPGLFWAGLFQTWDYRVRRENFYNDYNQHISNCGLQIKIPFQLNQSHTSRLSNITVSKSFIQSKCKKLKIEFLRNWWNLHLRI